MVPRAVVMGNFCLVDVSLMTEVPTGTKETRMIWKIPRNMKSGGRITADDTLTWWWA